MEYKEIPEIKFMKVFYDADKKYERAVISFSDESHADIEVKGYDEVVKMIRVFADQQGFKEGRFVYAIEIMDNSELVEKVFKEKKVEPVKTKEEVKTKDNSKKKKIIAITLLSAVLLGLGHFGFKGFKNKRSGTPEPKKEVVDLTEENSKNIDVIEESKTIMTKLPNASPLKISTSSNESLEPNTSKYPQIIEKIQEDDFKTSPLYNLANAFLHGTMKSDDELATMFEIINQMCLVGVDDTVSLVSGRELHFERVFEEGTNSYYVVDHFCKLKNAITESKYKGNDTSVLERQFLEEAKKFLYEGKAIKISGNQKEYTFDDVELLAKCFISKLSLPLFGDMKNYAMSVNGKEYKNDDLFWFVNTFDIEVMNDMQDRVNQKGNTM